MARFRFTGLEKTKPIKANYTYKQPLRTDKKGRAELKPGHGLCWMDCFESKL